MDQALSLGKIIDRNILEIELDLLKRVEDNFKNKIRLKKGTQFLGNTYL